MEDQNVTRVVKRSGDLEPVDLNKVVRAITRHAEGLTNVDPMRVALQVVSGVHDKIETKQLDALSIQVAASLAFEDPNYSKLAARILSSFVEKEVSGQDIDSFSMSIIRSYELGLVNKRVYDLVRKNKRKFNYAINKYRNDLFEYFGLQVVYDRYLLKNPKTREVIETPQYFFMRVAVALSSSIDDALELYDKISTFDYMPSTPTLFNSGTNHEQLSSCYLLDSPQDDLAKIYDRYRDIAQLSKFSGGIGVAFHRVRSSGSLIRSTNGLSNGLIPWCKILDSSVLAVNQCLDLSTYIYTQEGPKKLESVKEGDYTLGASCLFRRIDKVHVYDNKEPAVRIETKHSWAPVKLTEKHPVAVIRSHDVGTSLDRIYSDLTNGAHSPDWVDAGDVKEGDFVCMPIPNFVSNVPGFSLEDAYFYGIMLGNGHITEDLKEYGLTYNPETAEYREFLPKYLSRYGITAAVERKSDHYESLKWEVPLNDAGEPLAVEGSDKVFPFQYKDLYDENGEKRICARYTFLPKDHTFQLIRGMIETDGGVYRDSEIYFYTSSEVLAYGLRFQLLRVGIPSGGNYRLRQYDHEGTREDGTKVDFKGSSDAYDISIPSTVELASVLGCEPIEKESWITWGGAIWTRVKEVTKCEGPAQVGDLEVDVDENYLAESMLVHNGGRRKGAACVYLEPWHADIEHFLELRENTGDEARRTYNLNLANWIPDLFMERVEQGGLWSLFDPKEVPDLTDLFGDHFRRAYLEAEQAGLAKKTINAQDLYARMMRCLAQTGNGWMTWKDHANRKSNQTNDTPTSPVIHSSNLCVEILEVTNENETAVCNLASINLGKHVQHGKFDFEKLAKTVKVAVRQLDRVIDINFYPIKTAENSNLKWRPIGLGLMGLQDVFFQLALPFESQEARDLSKKISEEIYYHAVDTSCELAQQLGRHPNFEETRAAKGILQPDLWSLEMSGRWEVLRDRVKQHGLRNSLLIAIAPTATIASIVGAYECIEPQVSNLFKRETLSGDFLQVNRYLIEDLKRHGLWNQKIRDQIKLSEGSIQSIAQIPQSLKDIHKTVWEVRQSALIDLAADRGPYVDQSQSLNLFVATPNIGTLSKMYLYAWKKGIKTTYYLRSRPATKIQKATVDVSKTTYTDEEAVVCSLENPEACEACQ